MKLQQIPHYKFTTKKFRGRYKYKVVFVNSKASWFRGGVLKSLIKKVELYRDPNSPRLTKIIECLEKLDNYHIRVEAPYVAFYTDSESDAEQFLSVVEPMLKYVQYPQPGTEALLDQGLSIAKHMTYKYRVIMGRTNKAYPEFVSYIERTGKIGKAAKWELSNPRGSWGGYYFYIKDERSLTMAKLMIGDNIRKVEELTKK